ncbi:MAG: 50S ribosomal protein L11 methyltransferase [Anaerolineae bacterium]
MKWLEICVAVDSEEAAKSVCQVFDLYGEGGAVQEQVFRDQDQLGTGVPAPVTVKTYLPLDGRDEDRLQAIQTRLSHLSELLRLPPAQLKELEEKDWTTAWRAFFRPQRIGKRIVLKLPEQTYPAATDDVIIDLEPGMAFGTGLHATTRLCLACLEELVQPGDLLLDMGTGSGVLALAAARLGASEVLALDNDPTAVAVARENVARNCLGHAIRVEEGSLDYLTSRGIPLLDGIAMNIITEIIVEMVEGGLTSFLKPGGWLVASGILAPTEGTVKAAFDKCGMQVAARYQEEGWVALCGKKVHRERP